MDATRYKSWKNLLTSTILKHKIIKCSISFHQLSFTSAANLRGERNQYSFLHSNHTITVECPFFDHVKLRSSINKANKGEIKLREGSCRGNEERISISYCESLVETREEVYCIGYHEWTALHDVRTNSYAVIFDRRSWSSNFDTIQREQHDACREVIDAECLKLKSDYEYTY